MKTDTAAVTISIEDFDKICRICFKQNHLHKFQPDHYEFYETHFSIKTDEKGILPDKICDKCEFDLDFAFSFLDKCKNSEALLWEAHLSSKVKQEELIEETYVDIKHQILTPEIDVPIKEDSSPEIKNVASVPTTESEDLKVLDEKQRSCYIKLEKLDVHDIPSHTIPDEVSKIKTEKRNNQCRICKKNFSSRSNLTKHLIRHAKPEKLKSERHSTQIYEANFQCYTCNKRFTAKRNLQDHIYAHMALQPDNETFKCWDCGELFKRLTLLKAHLYQHYGKETFSCTHCKQVFPTPASLKLHSKRHSSVKPHKCDNCDKSFKWDHSLQIHKERHCAGNRKHQCPCCFKVFDSPITFKEHMSGHTEEKLFKCSICGNSYKFNADLTIHKQKHVVTEIEYKCYNCGRLFPTRDSLRRHFRLHRPRKLFKCTYCEKSFTTKKVLKSHTRTHTGEKLERSYKCSQCDKTYAYSTLLRDHLYSHTGERLYKCSKCDKDFSTFPSLHSHMKSHVARHRCTHCNEAFYRSYDLKIHIRSHTGEKVYKCSICDKVYLTAGTLKHHKGTHKKEMD